MDALKILLPYFLLMAAHIWAKRWTWCFTWTAICMVVVAAEILGVLQPKIILNIVVSAAGGIIVAGLLYGVGVFSNKRTISRDNWALNDKTKPEYNPLKAWACYLSWLIFAVYLFLHFVFHW
jgi:hypothetical protein